MDDGCGLWANRERAEMMFDPQAQFHLVLQDDAILCDNFIERAEALLKEPDAVYSFYLGARKAHKFPKVESEIKTNWLSWGVAVCIPTKIIPHMMGWCSVQPSDVPDDTRIARYCKAKGISVIYPLPSIVNHRHDEQSLVGNANSGGRKAYWFIGEQP